MDVEVFLCSRLAWIQVTFIILPPLLCRSIYSAYIAPECTLAGHKQLHWGLLYPPQCGWTDTLSVTGHRNRTAPLPYSQAQPGHKNTRQEETGREKRKQGAWLMAFFDLIFCHPTTGMIADCLRLSNCSFCAYLIGDKRLKCPSGMNLQHSCQCTKCFSAYKMADVIIFAMFA